MLIGWLIVISSLLVFILTTDADTFLEYLPVSPGMGVSADYFIQLYISQFSPSLYLYIFGFCLPAVAFFLYYKIIRYFLNINLSTLIALLCFSSIDGYPFHHFILDLSQNDIKSSDINLIRGMDFSTVLALSALAIILNAKFLYIKQSWLAVVLISTTILFDSLDGLAVSAVFISLVVLKRATNKTNMVSSLLAITLVCLTWVSNLVLFSTPEMKVADLPNLQTYLLLYTLLPATMFLIAAYFLKVDFYQIFRRFSSIILVFFSECVILITHYGGAFEVLLTELQFYSIFSFFHILYFVPTLFWCANSGLNKLHFPLSKTIVFPLNNSYTKFFVIMMSLGFLLFYNLLVII